LPVRWVNHPGREADAAYKPLQLATAARCGLTVTDTLVTNMPDAVHRFAAAHGDVVTKMFGATSVLEQGGRRVAHTERLTPSHLADLRGIEVTAHQFQRWVPKAHEARVVVVGDSQFAVEIHAGSEASYVDWRTDYDNLTYERVDPPEQVTAGIQALMRELGLAFGALDFVVTPGGEWVFLEVNPGGQYGWLETHTGIPVTATLADLLTEEET
jgi:glutathione synthase/RimK-type ligase-like ATP-grasp enzyme